MLLIQFGTMVVDRALYLRKTLFGKCIFQVVLGFGIHFWMFFILPGVTERSGILQTCFYTFRASLYHIHIHPVFHFVTRKWNIFMVLSVQIPLDRVKCGHVHINVGWRRYTRHQKSSCLALDCLLCLLGDSIRTLLPSCGILWSASTLACLPIRSSVVTQAEFLGTSSLRITTTLTSSFSKGKHVILSSAVSLRKISWYLNHAD